MSDQDFILVDEDDKEKIQRIRRLLQTMRAGRK